MLDNLAAAGVSPDDIDIVINSHLHFDHCGWNTVLQGDKVVPTFPKAKYYAPEGEWQHGRLQLERDAISYISDNYDPLIKPARWSYCKEIAKSSRECRSKCFPATPSTCKPVIIKSRGQTACYISDLIPTGAHIDLTWGMAFDLLPLQTIESRKRYYAQSIPEKWLTLFTHDPNIPWAYVEKDEEERWWREP